MDEALGPPPEMAEKADELTPMLSQYLELCERYDDAVVLFSGRRLLRDVLFGRRNAARILRSR